MNQASAVLQKKVETPEQRMLKIRFALSAERILVSAMMKKSSLYQLIMRLLLESSLIKSSVKKFSARLLNPKTLQKLATLK